EAKMRYFGVSVSVLLSMMVMIVWGDEEKKNEEKKEESKALRLVQEFRSVQQRIGEDPTSVKTEQTVSVYGKKVGVRTKGFGLRYIFDGEKEEIIVINEEEKQFYSLPFSLMGYYYALVVEGVVERLRNEKSAAQKLPEEERKRYEEACKERWSAAEAFLRKTEPSEVKVETKELSEKVCGYSAKEIKVVADGKVVVEATVTLDVKLDVKILAFFVLASSLPNKVRTEVSRIEGLPLRYKEYGRLGDFKSETETKVKSVEKESVKEEEVASEVKVPDGYTEVKEPEIVQSLRMLKERGVK
ncbi:MAG: hypothetical protein N2234_08640, partial [Planctomycetota bacterium]|nr:hypothetical protein [Planctomycetota bacterium]